MNEYDFGNNFESGGSNDFGYFEAAVIENGAEETPSPETLAKIEEDWYEGENREKKAEKGGDHTAKDYRLKHLGETMDVSKDELIRLAQKGLDYDRIRGKYTELSAFKSENAKAFDYLSRIAGEKGLSVKEFVGENAAPVASVLTGENARMSSEIGDFLSFCPDVQLSDIDNVVWEDAARGMGLFAAYTLRQNEKLRAELEAERQNRINREASVASRSSDGRAERLSEIERLWYSDD